MKFGKFFSFGLILGGLCCAPLMADQWFNVDVPMNMLVTDNSCVGQNIAFQGNMHISWNVTTNKSTIHIQEHVNSQNITGVGLTDGSQYMLLDTYHMDNNIGGTLPIVLQTNMDFAFIGKGQAPNARVRVVAHTTVNGAGNLAVDFSKASLVCQQ